MKEVMVEIGATYEVVEDYGKYLKKGEQWYAWYYGELILLERVPGSNKFTNRELPFNPANLLKAIKSGKVRNITIPKF